MIKNELPPNKNNLAAAPTTQQSTNSDRYHINHRDLRAGSNNKFPGRNLQHLNSNTNTTSKRR